LQEPAPTAPIVAPEADSDSDRLAA
jgi:hypothetical protein